MSDLKSKGDWPRWFWPLMIFGASALAFTGYDKIYEYLSHPVSGEQYRKRTIHEIEHTEHLSPISRDSTGQDKDKSGKENQQSKDKSSVTSKSSWVKGDSDLLAQEGMWKAANTLVWLTFLQMIIGIGTLGFLAWTLITQRSELKEARNVTLAQRAWMIFEGGNILNIEDNAILINLVFRNCGQTPALRVLGLKGAAIIPETESTERPAVVINTHYESEKGFGKGPNQLFEIQKVVEENDIRRKFKDGEFFIVISASVQYRTIYAPDIVETLTSTYACRIQSSDDSGRGSVSFSNCEADITYEDQGPDNYVYKRSLIQPS